MKTISRILASLFILIWILIVTCYIYIRLNGRQLIVNTLSQVFDRPVTLKEVHFLFPVGARISDLIIDEVLSIKDVQLQVGLPDLINHRFHLLLLSLSEPIVSIHRTADSKLIFGNSSVAVSRKLLQPSSVSTEPNPSVLKPKDSRNRHKGSVKILIDYLLVEKGGVKFLDLSRGRNFQLTLNDVDVKAQNVAIPPHSLKTKVDVSAVLFKNDSSFSGSRVNAQGWADFYKKDMLAQLNVVDPDGKVGLSAQAEAKNNELMIDGKIHITNLIADTKNQSKAQNSLTELIFSSLKSSGVEIIADFHAQTKMDNIQLDSISFSGNLGYKIDATTDGASTPAIPSGDIKNIGESFEELGRKFYKENVLESVNKEVVPGQ